MDLKIGLHKVSSEGPAYLIAEIGHNHQGSMETALALIKAAAKAGVQAVKFQKRNNKLLYTAELYNQPYDNENSYGATYGEHREALEFNIDQYRELKQCATEWGVDFIVSVFDFDSLDAMSWIGLDAWKIASGDCGNIPLIRAVAKQKEPIIISTGGHEMAIIYRAFEAAAKYNPNVILLHCVATYPTEYEVLNLKTILTLKTQFPRALIGFSSHDPGILAPVLAYMIGAAVIEKHFTMNRAWKGTDHKFSLEPHAMQKLVKDLHRVDVSLGDGVKRVLQEETPAIKKMGKSLYLSHDLSRGHKITEQDLSVKCPGGNGIPPSLMSAVIGQYTNKELKSEYQIEFTDLVVNPTLPDKT